MKNGGDHGRHADTGSSALRSGGEEGGGVGTRPVAAPV